jgi:hypothetical protein
MAAISYRPGPWLGLVRGGTMVLLDGGTREDVVHDLWAVLADRPTLQSVLGAVVGGYGSDLAALPEFAIISFDGTMHTILRGDVVVNTDGSDGAAELSGQGVTTWTERLLPEQEAFDVVINAGKEGACRWLPLAEGVVQLGGIRVGNDDGGIASSGAPNEDAADPVPAPRTEAAAPQEPVRAAHTPAPHHEEPVAPPTREQASLPHSGQQHKEPVASDVPEQISEGAVPLQAPEPEAVGDGFGPKERDALDALDAPASDDTLLTPGDAEHLGSWDRDSAEGDIEQTVVHTKAQRANLPANPTAGPIADPAAASAQAPRAAAVTGAPAAEPAQAPVPVPAKQTASLIDSVPWLTPSASARARAAESQAAEAAGLVQPVPAQPAVPVSAQPAAPARPLLEGDHDGQTLMRSDLKSLPQGDSAPAAPTEPPATTAPMVLARVCPQGHANPPTRSACSRCAAPLASDASEVKRPSLGKMRLSTGEVVELDRPVIVGRQPAASRVQGNVMPQLVPVRSVSGDISRSHLEVRLEGWHVILGDLKATNGTMLIREGQPPRRLGQGESMILFDGDIADLGDGVSLRFEDLL